MIQAREDAEKREAVRIAKKAEATMILGEWNAGKEKDQALIDKIKTEAASRDKMRRAQLKEEKKQKEEVKRAKRNAARKYAREMEKMEKISRKDIRERNRVYVSSSRRLRSRMLALTSLQKTSPLTPLGPLRRSARLAAKSLAAMRD